MIAIGSDHGGFELKEEIIKYLKDKKMKFKDCGCYDNSPCDYPEYGQKVSEEILNGNCKLGIVICGTGIGISIAANRHKGIRAALCTDCFMAKAAKEHNNANVLALGGRVTGKGTAVAIVDVFLKTEFTGEERHVRRINQIEG